MGSGIDLGEFIRGSRTNTLDCEETDLDLSSNFYSGNDAKRGNTLATTKFKGNLNSFQREER